MKRLLIGVLTVTVLAGCGRSRYDHIDIAASEKALAALEAGFVSVPDSLPGGRTAYLMGQGVPVADIIVYRGEVGDSLFKQPSVPYGFSCESIDTSVLKDSLHTRSRRLYTDGGLNGRLLYLQDSRMSKAVLDRIAELASQGAFIGGMKPSECLDTDSEVFLRTVEKVWLSGNVMSGKTVKSILKAAGVRPDMKTKVEGLAFQHRHLPDAEIYRICNTGYHSGPAKVRFRVRGRQPLQWNPDSGEIRPVSYKMSKRGTRVTFNTVPGDETFIVFASFADRRKLKVK